MVIDRLAAIRTSNKLLIIFNGLLVVVGFLQVRTLKQQADVMKATRDVSVAALGRPFLFVEVVFHNLEKWREGEERFYFEYRVINYGNSPAIVRGPVARSFFSRGIGFGDDLETSDVTEFPSKDTRWKFITDKSFVYVSKNISEKRTDTNNRAGRFKVENYLPWDIHRDFIISPDRQSEIFTTPIWVSPLNERIAKGSFNDWHEYLFRATAHDGGVRPWLAGFVEYTDIRGERYYTSFCFYGFHDGTTVEEYGPPYNERT